MKKNEQKTGLSDSPNRKEPDTKLPPFPANPPGEDIYDMDTEEQNIDPEDVSKRKQPNAKEKPVIADAEDMDGGISGSETNRSKKSRKNNEKDFDDDVSGDDLDVPGAETDEGPVKNGKEDEENDYYSLGGDDHNDLDEDRGE